MKKSFLSNPEIYTLVSANKLRNETGIGICFDHSGKMSNLWSLSTSCLRNPVCIARMKAGNSVCSHCFASAQQKRYKSLEKKNAANLEILTSDIVTTLPIIPVKFFRFEAFGDLANKTQVKNYFNICYANPETNFALWTKKPGIHQTGNCGWIRKAQKFTDYWILGKVKQADICI